MSSDEGSETMLGRIVTACLAFVWHAGNVVKETRVSISVILIVVMKDVIIWSYDHMCKHPRELSHDRMIRVTSGTEVIRGVWEPGMNKVLGIRGANHRGHPHIDHGRPWSTMADHGRL